MPNEWHEPRHIVRAHCALRYQYYLEHIRSLCFILHEIGSSEMKVHRVKGEGAGGEQQKGRFGTRGSKRKANVSGWTRGSGTYHAAG